MRTRRRATLATAMLVAVAGPALAGCGNRQAARFQDTGHHLTVTATVGAGGAQRVDIDATDADRFFPDTIVVHPGVVTLVVHNDGVVPHTLEIPRLRVDTGNIGKHQVRTVTFTVRRPGSYPFDCAYHLPLHMDGILRVVAG